MLPQLPAQSRPVLDQPSPTYALQCSSPPCQLCWRPWPEPVSVLQAAGTRHCWCGRGWWGTRLLGGACEPPLRSCLCGGPPSTPCKQPKSCCVSGLCCMSRAAIGLALVHSRNWGAKPFTCRPHDHEQAAAFSPCALSQASCCSQGETRRRFMHVSRACLLFRVPTILLLVRWMGLSGQRCAGMGTRMQWPAWLCVWIRTWWCLLPRMAPCSSTPSAMAGELAEKVLLP